MTLFKTLLALVILAPTFATADEGWVPPSRFEADWSAGLAAMMPGHSVTGCGVVNSLTALAVVVQCTWIAPDGRDVGYVTQSLADDGSLLCGWGEMPEALEDNWMLDLASGAVSSLPDPSPCPAPVHWDAV